MKLPLRISPQVAEPDVFLTIPSKPRAGAGYTQPIELESITRFVEVKSFQSGPDK
jgi:hypothetical protein